MENEPISSLVIRSTSVFRRAFCPSVSLEQGTFCLAGGRVPAPVAVALTHANRVPVQDVRVVTRVAHLGAERVERPDVVLPIEDRL